MALILPWITLGAPLASVVLIVLLFRRYRTISAGIAIAAVLISFLASCIVFALPVPTQPNEFVWIELGATLKIPIGVLIDPLSKAMLLIVTSIAAIIHIYSLGYMAKDDGQGRYFAGLSLFVFSMLGIVLANNFVMMFVFWELVGVSSYLLIGHWFYRDAPPAAANKAFITNRIGDFGFMLGILMLWLSGGTIVFSELNQRLGTLTQNPAYFTAATLLIFCGAVGKSAQFPLHVWLPDAMEGPTPVSALIHAATMVAAGVYMLVRVGFLLSSAPQTLEIIAWVGTITALLAGLMATQQNDIKRILAYSTLSQLGYMIMAVGLASGAAAMYHLFTHAFFKALLFLGAGSVIHSLHHEQNIWQMGGLKNKMPTTFLTFLVGTLALTGCPFLSGSFSKDAILTAAYDKNPAIFVIGLVTAFLTAFYMFRLYTVVFLGGPRSEAAKHGGESPGVMTVPLIVLAVPSVIAGYHFISRHILSLPAIEENRLVELLAFGAFAIGASSAYFLYYKKSKDPVYIPLFANKFYFDELYSGLIRFGQDLLATCARWIDRVMIDGMGVKGASRGIWGTGFVMTFLQVGNLQGYAFLFGAGVVTLVYFVVFR
jgi:NADH-quinone oxidoreductase subunit L